MPTTPVTIIRRLFEAADRGDGEAFLRLCHPDVEYESRTEQRTIRGREAVGRWLARRMASDVEIDAVPQDYSDRGDHVIVAGRLRIWREGALEDAEAAWCFEVEDDLVTKIMPVDAERARSAA